MCYTENGGRFVRLLSLEVWMQAPNVVSVAIIVGVIALCEGLAETLPILGEPWVPFAVVVLGALVKGLQVIRQDQRAVRSMTAPTGHKVRRWLIN